MALQWDDEKRTARIRFRLKLRDEAHLEERLVEIGVDSLKVLMVGGS
jgi:hypothetical protein